MKLHGNSIHNGYSFDETVASEDNIASVKFRGQTAPTEASRRDVVPVDSIITKSSGYNAILR